MVVWLLRPNFPGHKIDQNRDASLYIDCLNTPTDSHQPTHTNRLTPTDSHQPTHTNRLTPTDSHQPTHTNRLTPTDSHQPTHTNPLTPTHSHQPTHTNPLTPTDSHQPQMNQAYYHGTKQLCDISLQVDIVRAAPPNGDCVEVDGPQNEQVNAFLGEVPTIGYSAAVSTRQLPLIPPWSCVLFFSVR